MSFDYTIIGASGFVGKKISEQLNKEPCKIYCPKKDELIDYSQNLGVVIYTAGYGDCNKDPYNVVAASVALLSDILKNGNFDKLIYFSSTRLYMGMDDSREDNPGITVLNQDSRRLFNLAKMTGEELCRKSSKNIVIVRPSNIYGLALQSPLFLPSIMRDAILKNEVNMYVQPDYAKDYINVDDVVTYTLSLAKDENITDGIYNIASGVNVSAKDIAKALIDSTNCNIVWHSVPESIEKFPATNIEKIKNVIQDYNPSDVLLDIGKTIEQFRIELGSGDARC